MLIFLNSSYLFEQAKSSIKIKGEGEIVIFYLTIKLSMETLTKMCPYLLVILHLYQIRGILNSVALACVSSA
jgi:hypothetical protein